MTRAALCLCLAASYLGVAANGYHDGVQTPPTARPQLSVKPTADFEVNGNGDHAAWKTVEWTPLQRRQADGHPYDTRFKVLYSPTGVYFLMEGTDRKLTATLTEDFAHLWTEDVFEVFLWPDERYPVYFEYEISPLNHELPILIPNFGGQFLGWRPWDYDKNRMTRKATSVTGGAKQSGAAIQGWRAEFVIPVRVVASAAERPAEARHEVASELLPHGSRRREVDPVGLGARRPELP